MGSLPFSYIEYRPCLIVSPHAVPPRSSAASASTATVRCTTGLRCRSNRATCRSCLHMSPNSSRVYEKSVCPKRGLGRRRPPHGHMARTQNLERRAAIPGRHYVEHFAEHLRGGPRSAWGVQAAFDYKLQEILPLLFQPLLLLNPEDDLHENSRQAASLIRNGRVHELPRCSHSFLDIATEEVAALIRQFLDE